MCVVLGRRLCNRGISSSCKISKRSISIISSCRISKLSRIADLSRVLVSGGSSQRTSTQVDPISYLCISNYNSSENIITLLGMDLHFWATFLVTILSIKIIKRSQTKVVAVQVQRVSIVLPLFITVRFSTESWQKNNSQK